MSETPLIEPSVTGMLPGTPIESLEELAALPQYSVVLVRSEVQPHFRTAWTLSIIYGVRTWHSSSWRADPSDQELFDGAKEPIILLYKPLEQFGIGSLYEKGWLDSHKPVTVHDSLPQALEALGAALESDPNAAVTHRIHPGRWQLHEA
ncbi:hypothetical protein [Paenarthrobacter sp. YJN-5]|uniref:hypothetical protein n=1 Tax=Paenarthrobacter sp. YJN-5 TaxID=2735316 RepID=UPI001D0CCDFB|nr:hypothetical protein [Paenarthrobacter sp. YJN-5]